MGEQHGAIQAVSLWSRPCHPPSRSGFMRTRDLPAAVVGRIFGGQAGHQPCRALELPRPALCAGLRAAAPLVDRPAAAPAAEGDPTGCTSPSSAFLIQTVYFGLSYIGFKAGVSAGGARHHRLPAAHPRRAHRPALHGREGEPAALGWGWRWGWQVRQPSSCRAPASNSSIRSACWRRWVRCSRITAGTLWEKRFGKSHHPVVSNAVQYLAGLAGMLPLALVFESFSFEWNLPFVGGARLSGHRQFDHRHVAAARHDQGGRGEPRLLPLLPRAADLGADGLAAAGRGDAAAGLGRLRAGRRGRGDRQRRPGAK